MRQTPSVNPVGIVFFDIDGTLVTGMSSGSFLAQRLGHATDLDDAEAAYAAGTLSNHDVCVIDAKGWAGYKESEVDAWLHDLPLVDGIAETIAWCTAHDITPVLASLAWDVVGTHLADRFGFESHCGPTLETAGGHYTGAVAATFDEHGKRDFALAVCARLGVSPARCVAIGDSRSDLPLFEAVGHSIAFNASPDARQKASVTVDTTSMADVIPLLEAWLANAGTQ